MKYRLIVLFAVAMALTNCGKGKLEEEYFLNEGTKEVVPYIGNELLIFKENFVDTVSFVGSERINEMRDSYVSVSSNDYNLWEYNFIKFSNSLNIIELFLQPSVTKDSIDIMTIYFKDIEGNYIYFFSKFNIVDGLIRAPLCDSVLVNQKWFNNVYCDTVRYQQPRPIPENLMNYPIKIYYSTEFGILKIDFSDGSFWELESIEWAERE